MIQLTPAYLDAMKDPELTGTARRMYDWCYLHLDVREHRPIKRSVIPPRMAEKLPMLVALGYLEEVKRPGNGENTYRLYWSRRAIAA